MCVLNVQITDVEFCMFASRVCVCVCVLYCPDMLFSMVHKVLDMYIFRSNFACLLICASITQHKFTTFSVIMTMTMI